MQYIRTTEDLDQDLILYGTYLLYNPTTNVTKLRVSEKPIYIGLDDFVEVLNSLKKIASDLKIVPNEYPVYQYIRSNKYNGSTWNIVAGVVNSEFKKIADKEYSMIPNIQKLILPNKEYIDFPHFAAVFNGLINKHGDLCGYCGDIVQFAKDIKENPMVEFPSGHFGIEDLRTDIDAYNIFKMNNSDTINSFKSYYENMSDKKRFSLFLEDHPNILDSFNNSTDNFYLNILKQTTDKDLTDEHIKLACQKMQLYLENNKG